MQNVLKQFDGFSNLGTCSIDNPKEGHTTFVKNIKAIEKLMPFQKRILVLVPFDLKDEASKLPVNCKLLNLEPSDNVDYIFTYIHNTFNETMIPSECVVHPSVKFGLQVVIGAQGLKIVEDANSNRLFFKHVGNVIIKENVFIEAHTVIHRGSLDSTIIEKDVVIGSLCNIGHNCIIDERTILTSGVHLGGGAKIGKSCWIGMNATIGHKVSVCNNVMIGMGSVVTKSITKSGVYFGIPAIRRRSWDGKWTSR